MQGLIDMFKLLLDLIKIQTNENPQTPTSEGVDDAYKWFLETLEDRDNKRVVITNDKFFKPGKIYVFKYDPKYKTTLDYYDMNPVIIALGQTMGSQGRLEVGINISWYPPSARKYIISKIKEFYKPMIQSNIKKSPYDAEGQGFLPIDLYNLKTALDQVGLSFAIRNYIPERIKEPKAVVCYEDWEIVSRMDKPKIIPQFEGKISLFDVYKAYENYVKNYRQNAAKYKQKMDTAKKLNRYKFIK